MRNMLYGGIEQMNENYKVLIAEDDPMVAMINSQYVEKAGCFEIAGICRNGKEVLDFLLDNKVDLILLDVFMPVMDGRETLKKIREEKTDVEVIMVTAANDTTTIEETVHLGVHDYLIKPFTFERLCISLEKFICKKNLLKENSKMTQSDVDSLMMNSSAGVLSSVNGSKTQAASLSGSTIMKNLPKGIQRKTLENIISYFEDNSGWSSTDMISESLGISIVTVRNYMNYLVNVKVIVEDINYGTGGRPSMLYKKKS